MFWNLEISLDCLEKILCALHVVDGNQCCQATVGKEIFIVKLSRVKLSVGSNEGFFPSPTVFGLWMNLVTCLCPQRPNFKVSTSMSTWIVEEGWCDVRYAWWPYSNPLLTCMFDRAVSSLSCWRQSHERHQTGRRLWAHLHLQAPHSNQVQPFWEGKGENLSDGVEKNRAFLLILFCKKNKK